MTTGSTIRHSLSRTHSKNTAIVSILDDVQANLSFACEAVAGDFAIGNTRRANSTGLPAWDGENTHQTKPCTTDAPHNIWGTKSGRIFVTEQRSVVNVGYSPAPLVLNTDFAENTDYWATRVGTTGTISWDAGQMIYTMDATARKGISQLVNVVIGKTYRITASIRHISGSGYCFIRLRSADGAGGVGYGNTAVVTANVLTEVSLDWVATVAACHLTFECTHQDDVIAADYIRMEQIDEATDFQDGEMIAQTVSGASGRYIRKQGTDAVIVALSGTFDETNRLYGQSSGFFANVVSLTQNDFVYTLSRADSLEDNFRHVLDTTVGSSQPLLRCFCDAGIINYDGVAKETLFFAEYDSGGTRNRVYVNFPEESDRWQVLIDPIPVGDVSPERPIRHWHGIIYWPGVGPGQGRLVLLSGDTDSQSSICYCDDVSDFVANPSTWFERWGLQYSTATSPTRLEYLAANNDYVAKFGTQAARTVDLILNASKTAAYYVPDSQSDDALEEIGAVNRLHKIDMSTMQVHTTDSDYLMHGSGWYGHLAYGQIPIISEISEAIGYKRSDLFVRLYAILNDRLVEVDKYQRADSDAPVGSADIINITEYNDAICFKGNSLFGMGHKNVKSVTYDPLRDYPPTPTLPNENYWPNPQIVSDDLSHIITSGNISEVIRVTDVHDDGMTSSMRVTTGPIDGNSYVTYSVPLSRRLALLPEWITLSLRVLNPDSPIYIGLFPGTVVGMSGLASKKNPSPVWVEQTFSFFVPSTADNLTLVIYTAWPGDQVPNTIWLSDICITQGIYNNIRNIPFTPDPV